ncbi:MAG: tRNA (adenosine(37)-N6)-threonylcarbamoyltransferase complex dimerization subunit type 1 TsaB [Pseudomonadota bacterium]
MNTLVVDTSSPYCSVALQCEAQIFFKHERVDRRHNEVVLQMLDELFVRAELDKAEIQLIGFNAGPGSFTGVRIGAAIVQALSFASQAKVVAIDSSRVILNSLLAQDSPAVPGWVVATPSRANLYYLSAYLVNPELECKHADKLCDQLPVDFQSLLAQGWGLCGTLPSWLDVSEHVFCEQMPDAQAQLAYVLSKHHGGQSHPAELALPRYLPEDSPWKPTRTRANST